jgi:hypothetical protein
VAHRRRRRRDATGIRPAAVGHGGRLGLHTAGRGAVRAAGRPGARGGVCLHREAAVAKNGDGSAPAGGELAAPAARLGSACGAGKARRGARLGRATFIGRRRESPWRTRQGGVAGSGVSAMDTAGRWASAGQTGPGRVGPSGRII